ncbi:MAG: YidH family protein [Sulfobacillus sp.]
MAFGFVVSKFDLFLHIATHQPYHEGLLGLFLVAGGVMVIAFASLHYHRNLNRLERQQPLSRSKLPIVMGLALVTVGVLVFIYLVRAP